MHACTYFGYHHPPGLPLPSKLDWHTPHPSPGPVPSTSLHIPFHVTWGNFDVDFHVHTHTRFGQHHPPAPPLLNLPPALSPPIPFPFPSPFCPPSGCKQGPFRLSLRLFTKSSSRPT